MTSLDFEALNQAACAEGRSLVQRLIPGGKFRSTEYIVRNPRRNDYNPGSFSINYRSGKWSDFATGDKGGDFISLAAYIKAIGQGDAACKLAEMIGFPLLRNDYANGSRYNGAQASGPNKVRTAEPASETPDAKHIAPSFPPRTPADAAGKPRFIVAGDGGPSISSDEVRRHVYRRNGAPCRIKIKFVSGSFANWYCVADANGAIGWQAAKPAGYIDEPYITNGTNPFDREVAADRLYWPEGEKDVDTISHLGFLAFTFGGTGDGLPAPGSKYLAGRNVVILVDNDDPGRKHAEAKAAIADGVASSVRMIDLPGLPLKGDVTDWVAQGHTTEELTALVDASPLWVPGPAKERSGLALWWHGETDANADRAWLVEGLLPEIGTAIMAGPWGSYKTFVALDLALSAMRRETFAGRAINKHCGVLFIAAEGAFEVPIRLQGAYEASCDDHSPLPFASADECPRLLDQNALAILDATARDAAQRIRSKHGLDLGVIMIDTMAAAAGFDDENSNSEAQRVMNVLTALAHRFRCLVLVVDHFGKTAETGTRGGSAKEGSADAVLAILADRDLSGNVSNPRMAVRKVRGAPTGNEIPFDRKVVNLGLDKNGQPQTTLVIQWKQEGAAFKKTGADPWPRPLLVFRDALLTVLAEHGIEQRPFSDGPVVRAVDTELVRGEFHKRYPADGDTEEKRQEARRKAYNRSLNAAQQQHLIGVAVAGSVTLIWSAKGGSNGDDDRDRQDNPLCSVLSVPVPQAPETVEPPVDAGGTNVPPCPVPAVPHSESPSVVQEASKLKTPSYPEGAYPQYRAPSGDKGAFVVGGGP